LLKLKFLKATFALAIDLIGVPNVRPGVTGETVDLPDGIARAAVGWRRSLRLTRLILSGDFVARIVPCPFNPQKILESLCLIYLLALAPGASAIVLGL